MRGQPCPPTKHPSVFHTGHNPKLMSMGCMYLWFLHSPLPIHVNGGPIQVLHGSAVDTPSMSADNSHMVTTLSDSKPSLPSHCCYCTYVRTYTHTHTQSHLTKPQKAKANCASPPAEQRQLPQRHHSRPSLPVLATPPVSVPVRGLAHQFQSLELDRSQISKKPSVLKPSLLQLHFSASLSICRHPSSSEQRTRGSLFCHLGDDHARSVLALKSHQL